MTRPRKQNSHYRREPVDGLAPASPPTLRPTPVPPEELVARAGELREIVDELADLTGCASAWGVRVLRRNVELALLSPETLNGADNQLDFIEELAEAVWDGPDSGFRQTLMGAATPEEAVGRDGRRRALVARLDDLAHELCGAAEAWRDLLVATAEAAVAAAGNPQEEHRF